MIYRANQVNDLKYEIMCFVIPEYIPYIVEINDLARKHTISEIKLIFLPFFFS